MAIIKYRLMKDGGSGAFDTVHLETNSNMVLHGDTDVGQYLESMKTELAGKAASGHTHTLEALGAAAANHSHSQYLTAHQSLAGYVPTTRTVNGKALSANISLSAADVGAAASNHQHIATDITNLESVTGASVVCGRYNGKSTTITLPIAAKGAIIVCEATENVANYTPSLTVIAVANDDSLISVSMPVSGYIAKARLSSSGNSLYVEYSGSSTPGWRYMAVG